MVDAGGVTVVPGDCVSTADASEMTAGPGTIRRGKKIFATVAGTVCFSPSNDGVFINRRKQIVVPEVGSVVLAVVTRVRVREASFQILVVDGESVIGNESFQGVMRPLDVHSSRSDLTELHDCFVPQDVVRAKVVALGEGKAWHLSTAATDLGVVHAERDAGLPRKWAQETSED